MNYVLRHNFSKDTECLREILEQRGVENVDEYLKPSKECEINPYNLENIREGAYMLLRHLRNDSGILMIVDCD